MNKLPSKIEDKQLQDEWLKTGGISRAINVVALKVNDIISFLDEQIKEGKCNCQYEEGHSFVCPLYKEEPFIPAPQSEKLLEDQKQRKLKTPLDDQVSQSEKEEGNVYEKIKKGADDLAKVANDKVNSPPDKQEENHFVGVNKMVEDKQDNWEDKKVGKYNFNQLFNDFELGHAVATDINLPYEKHTEAINRFKEIVRDYINGLLSSAIANREKEIVKQLDGILAKYSIDRPIPPSVIRLWQDSIISKIKNGNI